MNVPPVAPVERPRYPIRLPLEYVDPRRLVVLYDLQMDDPVSRVKVIGDPENGAYEWLIEHRDGSVEFSDCGYGIAECALRDGLAMWWGDSVDIEKLKQGARSKTATQLRAYVGRE